MVIIRKAKLKDCEVVYKFGKSRELANPSGEAPKLWWIEAFVKEKQIFFVAEQDKDVIGFVIGERTTGNIGILQEIFVKQNFRNKGIGTALFKKFEEECKKRKINLILLYGYAGIRTIKFWEKRKFKKGSREYEFVKFLR